jgi:hypothetical protein
VIVDVTAEIYMEFTQKIAVKSEHASVTSIKGNLAIFSVDKTGESDLRTYLLRQKSKFKTTQKFYLVSSI